MHDSIDHAYVVLEKLLGDLPKFEATLRSEADERRAVSLWLDASLKKALILNYDPTRVDAESASQFEISPSGELHLYWRLGNYDYLLAMAETTAILNRAAFGDLENASRGQGSRRAHDVIGVFKSYLRSEDQVFCRPSVMCRP